MSKMLYNDRPEIDIEELSHIYMALITSADSVYINNKISVSTTQPKKRIEHIESSIGYLVDKGLIKFWSYPFDTPSQSDRKIEIFSPKEYDKWHKVINETFLNGINLISIFSLVNEPNLSNPRHLEERTSKIVAIRKEYWSFAVCSSLKLDQILNSYGTWQPNISNSKSLKLSTTAESLIRLLFSHYGIPDLGYLKGEDIYYLNGKNKDFRAVIDSYLPKSNVLPNAEIVRTAFDNIIKVIFELTDSLLSTQKKSIFFSTVMNVAGIGFAPVSWIPLGNDVLHEIAREQKYGFIYFLSEVKKLSTKRLKGN